METSEKIAYAITAIIVAVGCCCCYSFAKYLSEIREVKEQVIEIPIHQELTEWQLFQMALIEVESEYNSEAVSSENARGIFQELPVYIAEVNRLIGTDWTAQDAHNDTIALDCFTVMQRTYNPDSDIDRAIYLHNPKAGPWYRTRVVKKMAEIRRREQVRTLIVNY